MGSSAFTTSKILFGTDIVPVNGTIAINYDSSTSKLIIDAVTPRTDTIQIGAGNTANLVLQATSISVSGNVSFSGGGNSLTVPTLIATNIQVDTLKKNTAAYILVNDPFQAVSGSVKFNNGIEIVATGLTFDAAAGNNIKFSNVAENNTTATFVNDASGNPIIDLIAVASSNSWLQFSRDVAQASVSVVSTVSNAALLLNSKGTGQITANAQINAPSFNATSSRTAKRAIKKFKQSAIDIINGIDIVSYKYKNQGADAKEMVGFIAEDTDPLISGPDQKHFDINTTIGLLLKAVQELAGEVRSAHGV